jgi:hypothetical protein
MLRRAGSTVLLLFILFTATERPAVATGSVQLRLRVTGVGAAVEANPIGTLRSCDGEWCLYDFPVDTYVWLTPSPSVPTSRVARWLGPCFFVTPASTCIVRLNRSASITARFTPVQLLTHLDLSDQVGHAGSVLVSPPGRSCGPGCQTYPYGTQVSITAHASNGYILAGWMGLCGNVTSTSTCSFPLFASVSTAPGFTSAGHIRSRTEPLSQEVKTIVKVIGPGYVKLNGRSCTSVCEYQYERGTNVAVRAYTQQSSFRHWCGSCNGQAPRCQFTAFPDIDNNAPVVTATFR